MIFFRLIKSSFSDIKRKYGITGMIAWIVFFILIYIIFVIKLLYIQQLGNEKGLAVYSVYSIAISFYILSRFLLAYFYQPETFEFSHGSYEPTVSFIIPCYNEEKGISETIRKVANVIYPKDKFDIILINDGSTDNSLREMIETVDAVRKEGVAVEIINWAVNKGKRHGMAAGIRRSRNEIIILIDSDSFIEREAVYHMVKYFANPKIGAVAAHTFVYNVSTNLLTKMQSVYYYISFKVFKSAESLFGAVTCCPGCCSAYRKSCVETILDAWLNKKFLGIKATYGDDRSMTNFIMMQGYKTIFAPEAVAYTTAPDTLRQYLKQQLRWKKSWLSEGSHAARFMWKQNPIMSISFYIGFLLPVFAPFVIMRAFIWYPLETGRLPFYYLYGLLIVALLYGVYYYIHTKSNQWFFGVMFSIFSSIILIWQLPWALIRLRDTRWGTR